MWRRSATFTAAELWIFLTGNEDKLRDIEEMQSANSERPGSGSDGSFLGSLIGYRYMPLMR